MSSTDSEICVEGTKGEIQVDGPAFRPTRWRFIPAADDADPQVVRKGRNDKVREVECEIPGHGMFWEADECGRCVRDGKLESAGMGWAESLVIMETMDQVRKQGGVKYPEKIETTEYPVAL